jgi:hypothetical protein
MLWFLGFLTGFFAYKILEIIIINNFREIEIEEAIWSVLIHEMKCREIANSINTNFSGRVKTFTGNVDTSNVWPILCRMEFGGYLSSKMVDRVEDMYGTGGARAKYYFKKSGGRRLEIKSKQEVQETQSGLTLA